MARHKHRYDSLFEWYFYPLNPLWAWAMTAVESAFKPLVQSPVGARGLMQVMPATWYNEAGARWKTRYDGFDVEQNIKRGARELKSCFSIFRNPQGFERYKICTAAYNAGRRHIISAQLLATKGNKDERLWRDVADYLPQITGERSAETINHILRVEAAFIGEGGKLQDLVATPVDNH